MRGWSILLLAMPALAGCGGSSDATNADLKGGETVIATCDSLKGGAVTVAYDVCATCGVQDEGAVADDDAYSYATAVAGPAEAGGLRIRVTAPVGTVFPAGSDAGAFFTGPASTGSSNASVYQGEGIRTYLSGVQQETDVYGEDGNAAPDRNWAAVPTDDPNAPRMFRWIHTTKDFDAVEFVVTNLVAYGNDGTWKVHELCSNGWVYQPSFTGP